MSVSRETNSFSRPTTFNIDTCIISRVEVKELHKCVSLLDINFDGFSLSTTDIVLACCYEKDLQFSQEI